MTDKHERSIPEALRLADRLYLYSTGDEFQRDAEDAAAELRRLHEVNAELVEALQWIAAMTALPMQYQTLAKIVLAKAQGDNNERP